jgi:DNA-binding GntR family transcriptional regulator
MAIKAGLAANVNPEAEAAALGAIVPRRSLVDDVYERLIELLLDAEFEPGERLPIDALARAWEVSPTPIREALIRAEASGLVVRQALKGYQVAPLLPPEEFEQLMEMRLLIEPYCAAKTCERASDEVLHTLEQQHKAMMHAPTGPTAREYREYLRADVAFHETIVAAGHNRFLEMALSVTSTHAHRFRRFSGGMVNDAPDALHEHGDILTALLARDAKAADAAMRRHLEGVSERGRAAS